MNQNIILCGFMGSGKSTVGAAAARLSGRQFVDLDQVIEARAGLKIPEIFAVRGESGFRDAEYEAARALGALEGHVIATGGGTMTYPRNVDVLRKTGIVIFLSTSFEDCYRRIQYSDRPLVRKNTPEELESLYQTRARLYEACADFSLPAAAGAENTAKLILDWLSSRLSGASEA